AQRNHVAWKLGAHVTTAGGTGCGGQRIVDFVQARGAVVAIAFGKCGDSAVEDLSLALPLPLVANKEKRLPLAIVDLGNHHRSAQRAAELVSLQNSGAMRKGIAGVELVIAQEFEQVAIQIIRTGFRGGIEGTARARKLSRK